MAMEHVLFTFAAQCKHERAGRGVGGGKREGVEGCVKINNNNCARIIKAKQRRKETAVEQAGREG